MKEFEGTTATAKSTRWLRPTARGPSPGAPFSTLVSNPASSTITQELPRTCRQARPNPTTYVKLRPTEAVRRPPASYRGWSRR